MWEFFHAQVKWVPDRGAVLAFCAVGNLAIVVAMVLLKTSLFPDNQQVGELLFWTVIVVTFPVSLLSVADPCCGMGLIPLNGCLWGFVISLVWEFIAEQRYFHQKNR